MKHAFPDATRDGLAQVFKCETCKIIETITEMRDLRPKQVSTTPRP
jgi:hypothetical protein